MGKGEVLQTKHGSTIRSYHDSKVCGFECAVAILVHEFKQALELRLRGLGKVEGILGQYV